MAYKPSKACLAAAAKAAGGRLNRATLDAAFQDAAATKAKLQAQGQTAGLPRMLKDAAARKAEQTRIAAAMRRRHAGLNILIRDRLDQTLDAFKTAGLTPRQSLLALMEGSPVGVANARNSVAATKLAYEAKFVGDMIAEIHRDRPHLLKLLNNKNLSNDVEKEMFELRQGGNPGLTRNDDAKYLANIFSAHTEVSRAIINKLGGSIGKLDGWAGAQVWDDIKLIGATKKVWTDTIGNLIDINRTFPDATSTKEVTDILDDIYDTIITGIPNRKSAAEMGKRVNPANLAKSLGKSRVLHFKTIEGARAAREMFGHGNTVSSMFAHQYRMASIASQMEVFGPNPEVMFRSLVESQARKLKDDTNISDKRKNTLITQLNSEGGKLRHAFDVMNGAVNRPEGHVTGAKLGADIRAGMSIAKLGAALLTAMPTDVMTAAAASMFRGGGFFRGLTKQLDGVFLHRPKGEVKEIGFLYGEGIDGMIGHINHAAVAQDGPMGRLSTALNLYFKANLLTPWTDTNRLVGARIAAAEMGMRAKTAYGDLPGAYRHLLSLHSITEARWDALRQATTREINGNDYITPDAIQSLPDAAVEPLVRGRLATAKTPARRAAILDGARHDLELSVLRLVADEVNYGTLEIDARSRRTTTLGQRPGTITGEVTRMIMQFKGYPIAFSQRILGRALFGHAGGTKSERLLAGLPHLGVILAGMTVAGYMSLTMKDVSKGFWPPRNPANSLKDFFKITGASMVQGGALGIYGDFLFAHQSRFGQSALESLEGPSIGALSQLANIALRARDGDPKAGDYLNFAINNAPLPTNLFYVRPALDFLLLNSLREAASPGYMHRQETRRLKDYNQRNLLLAH